MKYQRMNLIGSIQIMISKDRLVFIWTVIGFVSMITLFFEGNIKTFTAYGLLTLTIVSFVLALYFSDFSNIGEKPKKEDKK